ncbi:hypothetical protein AX774_g6855, partial [Zancudomyces culisetae]
MQAVENVFVCQANLAAPNQNEIHIANSDLCKEKMLKI